LPTSNEAHTRKELIELARKKVSWDAKNPNQLENSFKLLIERVMNSEEELTGKGSTRMMSTTA